MDNIFYLAQIIEKKLSVRTHLLLFIDLAKAYDSVPLKLENTGTYKFECYYYQCRKTLYREFTTKIKVSKKYIWRLYSDKIIKIRLLYFTYIVQNIY